MLVSKGEYGTTLVPVLNPRLVQASNLQTVYSAMLTGKSVHILKWAA